MSKINHAIRKNFSLMLIFLIIILQTNLPVHGSSHMDTSSIRSIAAGGNHFLVLKENGTVWTWGHNGWGQLGERTSNDSSTPLQVKDVSNIISVSGGSLHTVALKKDGTVWTWGSNQFGELGNGTDVNYSKTAVQVKGLTDIIAISAGGSHNAALKKDGTVWMWGGNSDGLLGIDLKDYKINIPEKIKGLTGVKSISCGADFTIALKKDGAVYGWGRNFGKQFGKNSSNKITVPILIKGLKDIVSVSCGAEFFLALKKDGTVFGAGCSHRGQLGLVSHEEISSPVQIKGLKSITSICAGWEHGIAIKKNGTVWAWGRNKAGQLGDGTRKDRISPAQINGLSNFTAIDSKFDSTIGLKKDGTVWIWGSNENNQLGNVVKTTFNEPVQLKTLNQVISLSSGISHTIALKKDGTVWAWGNNSYSQIGISSDDKSSYPVKIYGLTDIVSISAGGTHSAALKKDGSVWVWGSNLYTQLGKNHGSWDPIPSKLERLSKVTAVSAGATHTAALKKDGTVWIWGGTSFEDAQLNDIPEDTLQPVQVKNLNNVVAIVSGLNLTAAQKSDGSIWIINAFHSQAAEELNDITDISSIHGTTLGIFITKKDNSLWTINPQADPENEENIILNTKQIQYNSLSKIKFITFANDNFYGVESNGSVYRMISSKETTNSSYIASNYEKVELISSISQVSQIQSTFSGIFALKKDGTVWTWGNNKDDELGVGPGSYSSKPVMVKTFSVV